MMEDRLDVRSSFPTPPPLAPVTNPQQAFAQQLDAVLERLARADLSKRSPFANYQPNHRSVVLHADDPGTIVAPLFAGDAVSLSSCQPSVPERGTRSRQDSLVPFPVLGAETDDEIIPTAISPFIRRSRARARTYQDVCVDLAHEDRLLDRELGMHTLFLLVGLARWNEIPDPTATHRSPLLFVPVSLAFENAEWRMRFQDDEAPFVNHVLLKHLASHVSHPAALAPLMTEMDAETATYDDLLDQLHAAVPQTVVGASNLAIDRYQLSIATIKGGNYLLYQDIQRQSAHMLANDRLTRLFVANEASDFDEAADFERRRVSLDTQRSAEIANVLDMDSSQQVALTKAADGDSFILQGPPGTGKSQTIANIIAHALYVGRTVLFVSKKQEALDVVERRLTEAGLGDYLLSMHAVRAGSKAEMIARLQTLLARHEGETEPTSHRDGISAFIRLDSLREGVNALGAALLSEEPTSGLRPYDVLGRVALRAQRGVSDFSRTVPDTVDIFAYVKADRDDDEALLDQLTQFGDRLAASTTNAWLNAETAAGGTRWQRDQFVRLELLTDAAHTLERDGASLLSALTQSAPILTFGHLTDAAMFAAHLANQPGPVDQWMTEAHLFSEASRTSAVLKARCTQWHARHTALYGRVWAAFDALDHGALHARLVDADGLFTRFNPDGDVPALLFAEHDRIMQAIVPATLEAQEARLARTNLPIGRTVHDLRVCASLLSLLAERPSGWYSPEMVANPSLTALIREGRAAWYAYGAAWNQLDNRYDPKILDIDLALLHQHVQTAQGFFERRSREYRAALDQLQAARFDRSVPDHDGAIRDFDLLRRVQYARWHYGVAMDALQCVCPLTPQSDAEWETLFKQSEWIARVHDTITIDGMAAALLAQPDQVTSGILALVPTINEAMTAWSEAEPFLALAATTTLRSADTTARISRQEAIQWCRVTTDLLTQWVRTIDTLRSAYRPEQGAPGFRELTEDLATALTLREFEAQLRDDDATYRRLFGSLWRGPETDWDQVARCLDWWRVTESSSWWTNAPAQPIVEKVTANASLPDLVPLSDAVDQALSVVQTECAQLAAQGVVGVPNSRPDAFIASIPQAVRRLREDLEAVGVAREVADLRALAAQRPVLKPFLDEALPAVDPTLLKATWEQAVDIAWIDTLCERSRTATSPYAALARFDRSAFEQRREAFVREDGSVHQENRLRVRARLDDRIAAAVNAAQAMKHSRESSRTTELRQHTYRVYQQVQAVASLKMRTRKSVRRILNENGNLAQLLTPCWMMSPTSVTQYVDPSTIAFDLVVFDEASQLTTEDILPAIARGTQWIFVGDPQQMPPTDFFNLTVTDEDADSDDGDRVESVLDELKLQPAMLRWHYRSKDESLITFSNYTFYNGRLVTFPSPRYGSVTTTQSAVQWTYLPEGRYDRGDTQRNDIEAAEVARRIVQFWDDHKGRAEKDRPTLGVIALSLKQRDAIAEAVFALADRREDGDAMLRWITDPDSPSFLKNLETVQGNECDQIILSLGFGPGVKDGRMMGNFGPLNRAGGERRFNVAITRAREQMTVISSFRPEDVPESQSRGVQVLVDYLRYAKGGAAAFPAWTHRTRQDVRFDSPFEEAVYLSLVNRGFGVDTQVGVSRYRVDLAIRDPHHPGQYLLGIECDGATYHSSATARDRDRLRQRELEKLGWRIHRVWSSSWFTNPRGEIDRIVACVEQLRQKYPNSARV